MKTTSICLTVALSVALSGCSLLSGGSKSSGPGAVQYSPSVPVLTQPESFRNAGQLVVDMSFVDPAIDNSHIAVRPTPNELQMYKGARWANEPGDMVATALLRNLEASGAYRAVGRKDAGLTPDYRLVVELRQFEADYAGQLVPNAKIVMSARVVHAGDEKVLGTQVFDTEVPARSSDIPSVVAAYTQALAQSAADVTRWTIGLGAR